MKEWWTAWELAKLALPGLWKRDSHIRVQARLGNWRKRPHPRRRKAFEYHVDSLPAEAQQELRRQEEVIRRAGSAASVGLTLVDVASGLLPLLERVQRQLTEPHVWHIGDDEIERAIADLRAVLVP